MHIFNSFIFHMIANGYIVYKRSGRFFKLRLLFALVITCICICIPIGSSLLHTYVFRFEEDNGKSIWVGYGTCHSLSLYMSVHKLFVHAVGAWLNDAPFSYEELFVRIGNRWGQTGWCICCERIYVLRKPWSESRNLVILTEGGRKEPTTCQPHSYRPNEWEEHRLTLQLTLVFPIVRRWIIVSGLIFPSLIRARRACRGFIFFPCLNAA